MFQDLRHALRAFARTPAFTGVAILVLAIGIGANSAMFTVVNAMLFKPLSGQAGRMQNAECKKRRIVADDGGVAIGIVL